MAKEMRRNNQFFECDADYGQAHGKDTVIQFETKEECAKYFNACQQVRISGQAELISYELENKK
jgi:hypothetical protein